MLCLSIMTWKHFVKFYTQYSRALLPQNEVVVIGTQYESINDVKNTLLSGVDVERYLNEGTLLFLTLNMDTRVQTPVARGSLH